MTKPLFFPILDNGDGSVKASFLLSVVTSFVNQPLHITRVGDSHPGRARNRAAAEFLRTDCDYLLFIDADIVFDKDDIDALAASDEPILCGVYPKKQPGLALCAVAFEEGINVAENYGKAVPVRRSGTGFMRIHRSVFERMKEVSPRYFNHGEEQWDFFQSGVLDGEWLSEDWYFCDRARSLGFQIMLHLGIQTHHEGTAVYPLPQPEALPTKWQDIPGWFDYEDAYREIAAALSGGGSFVEVGSWMGRSIAAMASFVPDSVAIYAVDTFKGSDEEAHRAIINQNGGTIRHIFDRNMAALGLGGWINVIQETSVEAASRFADNSLDAVFIDAGHTYEDVAADLDAWMSKVKPGGILAGHDYDYPGVKVAVDERIVAETRGRCWLFTKPSAIQEL
jgi:predicted O-methyltransferase YrrM